MAASKRLKQILTREIKARQDRVGRVMSQREARNYNASSGVVWVCDVDIGSNRIMRDVPIKAVDGSRFYAERGQSVLLRRNTQGRYDIVGPSDKVNQIGNIKTYTLGSATPVTDNPQGFQISVEPFEYYEGGGGASLWNDGTTPFPVVRILDAAGNEV